MPYGHICFLEIYDMLLYFLLIRSFRKNIRKLINLKVSWSLKRGVALVPVSLVQLRVNGMIRSLSNEIQTN